MFLSLPTYPLSIMNTLGQKANILAERRAQCYKGSAVISISDLKFDNPNLDEQNVRRLEHIFETEGCWNLYPEYRVVALIGDSTLRASLASSGLSPDALLDPMQQPALTIPRGESLKCLYGKHRLRAALVAGETTWLVDLYLNSKLINSIPCSMLK